MSSTVISREQVHELAEACAADPNAFNVVATRLLKDQRRLVHFFEENNETMGMMAMQVGVYMLSVSLRVFEGVGGRMKKVSGADIASAQARVRAALPALAPFDQGFGERAKAWMDRSQPHLCDEVLWALYERPDAGVALSPKESALVYVMLWTAVESLALNWSAPKGFEGV
jgi:hypothetical protein